MEAAVVSMNSALARELPSLANLQSAQTLKSLCLPVLPAPRCCLLPAVNGLWAAKAAGCYAVAVATSLPADMLAPHADLVLEALQDLDLAAVGERAAAAAAGC